MKPNFVNGEWRQGTEWLTNLNPSDLDTPVGRYSVADESLLDEAVSVAKQAGSEWAQTTPQQRFDILDRIGHIILDRRQSLGELLASEEGKTLREAMGEVGRAGQIFKFFAGEALRPQNEWVPSIRPCVQVTIEHEPVGVVGLITPWNFPIAIPAWKVAPALAYGNSIILKPSEYTPGSAWALAEIMAEAKLPAGVFNLVMGGGSLGAAMVKHSGIQAISFTGSRKVGSSIAAGCAARMIRCQLEMGGKNPLIVLDDADLDAAVQTAVDGAFFSTGQRCTASSRILVTKGIYPKFEKAILERLPQLVVGHALAPETQIGPVAHEAQLKKNIHYLNIAKEDGATIAWGGQVLKDIGNGYFQAPALFTDTHNQMRINREEIFGPFASLQVVANYEEALNMANDTDFGLVAGICTTSLKYADHFRKNAKTGMAMVNLPTAGVDYHVPFGGRNGSSYGPREQGRYAIAFYTIVKTGYIKA